MNKERLAEMFGIDTYKKENDRLANDNNRMAKEIEVQKATSRTLADTLIDLEMKLELLKKEPDKYIEEEVKRRMELFDKNYKDRLYHRAFTEGRMAAYTEMGIWRLDAIKNGNRLVMDKNGEIYELLQDIEDITADVNEITTTDNDEIALEDLIC